MIKKILGFINKRIGKPASSAINTTGIVFPGKQKPPSTNSTGSSMINNVQQAAAHPRPAKKTRPSSPRKKQRKKPWNLDSFQVPPHPEKSRFHDFSIPDELMHAIADLEFTYCTPIQAKSLPAALQGKDIVGKANTGTGKSAVFLITILCRLLQKETRPSTSASRPPKALIIAPTRELVMQIAKDGRQLAKYTHLDIMPVYGGENYQQQQERAKKGTSDIIVATPGRLLDFVNKGVIRLDQCEIMVIDEGDRMLDMGFIPDVRRIISRISKKKNRQTMLFSATITQEVKNLAFQWCQEPEFIDIPTEKLTVDAIGQIVYLVTTEEKYIVLYNLIQSSPGERIIVFTNQKHEARSLSRKLQEQNIPCGLLSGDVPQYKRGKRLENFRSGKTNILIATDVAARGIHIEGVSYVVNFNLPYEPENYVHRIGRTGRAGALGTSISFACEEDAFYLPDIEEYIGKKLDCVVPEEMLLTKPPVKRKPKQKPYKKRAR